MHPKINFTINEQADLGMAKWFVKNVQRLTEFLPPELHFVERLNDADRNRVIAYYHKNFYCHHAPEIKRGLIKIKKDWARIQKKYFTLIDQIFYKHPWPPGNYLGHASIYCMYPRDIADKMFFLPYSKELVAPLRTIGHEMLHFMFFDFIKKEYGLKEDSKIEGETKDYIWRISETFNNVIENWPPYKKIFHSKIRSVPYYPGYEKMFTSMTRSWRRHEDLRRLLNPWLKK